MHSSLNSFSLLTFAIFILLASFKQKDHSSNPGISATSSTSSSATISIRRKCHIIGSKSNGALTGTFVYDGDKLTKKFTSYDPKTGKSNSYMVYLYKGGLIDKICRFDMSNKLGSTYNFTYSGGKLSRTFLETRGPTFDEYSYEGDKIVADSFFHMVGNSRNYQGRTTYEYDSRGNVSRLVIYNLGNMVSNSVFTYDDKSNPLMGLPFEPVSPVYSNPNNVLSEVTFNARTGITTTINYKIEYNSRGLPTKETASPGGTYTSFEYNCK